MMVTNGICDSSLSQKVGKSKDQTNNMSYPTSRDVGALATNNINMLIARNESVEVISIHCLEIRFVVKKHNNTHSLTLVSFCSHHEFKLVN